MYINIVQVAIMMIMGVQQYKFLFTSSYLYNQEYTNNIIEREYPTPLYPSVVALDRGEWTFVTIFMLCGKPYGHPAVACM